jgi:DNA-binding transcriptional ArsR family regulator
MSQAAKILQEEDFANRLAEVLKALAHPLRLRLVAALCQEDRNVQQLCTLLDVRQSLVSQHLSVLRMVGLLSADRSGGTATYTLKEPNLRNLVACLTGCKGR